jgi:hypothetical protein
MEGYGGYVFSVRVSSLDGAGDGTRTRDVQLGKTTVNWKQRTLRFQHLVLAIENTRFSLCVSAGSLTEHKRSTRIISKDYDVPQPSDFQVGPVTRASRH